MRTSRVTGKPGKDPDESTCRISKEAWGPDRGRKGPRGLLGRGVQADTCRPIRDDPAKGVRGWAEGQQRGHSGSRVGAPDGKVSVGP